MLPPIQTKELHIWDHPISKLYTDECGRFPIRYKSDNEYIMIAYHCDSNTILQAPFVNIKYKHIIRAYSSIMQRLTKKAIEWMSKSWTMKSAQNLEKP